MNPASEAHGISAEPHPMRPNLIASISSGAPHGSHRLRTFEAMTFVSCTPRASDMPLTTLPITQKISTPNKKGNFNYVISSPICNGDALLRKLVLLKQIGLNQETKNYNIAGP